MICGYDLLPELVWSVGVVSWFAVYLKKKPPFFVWLNCWAKLLGGCMEIQEGPEDPGGTKLSIR